MNNIHHVLIIVIATLTTTGCRLTQKPFTGPHQSFTQIKGHLDFSTNAILNLSKIEQYINNITPQQIGKIEDSISKCLASADIPTIHNWIQVRIEHKCIAHVTIYANGAIMRNGYIQLTGYEDSIFIKIPIRAFVRLTPKGDISRLTGLQETAEAEVTISLSGRVRINPDWSPNVTITSDFSWDKRPQIEILGIPITFGSKAEGPLREAINSQVERVSTLISARMIRDAIQNQWRTAFQPIQLNSNPDIWIAAKPSNITFSGIDIKNDLISASFGINGEAHIYLGLKPSAHPATPLPDLKINSSISSYSKILIPILIDYTTIRDSLNKFISERKINTDNTKIKRISRSHKFNFHIEEAFPSGDRIGLKIKIHASIFSSFIESESSLYVLLKPKIIHAERTIKADEIDIMPTTNITIFNTPMVAFLKSNIIKTLNSAFKFNYSQQYNQLRQNIVIASNRQNNSTINVRTELDELNITDTIITREGIAIMTQAAAKITLTMDP